MAALEYRGANAVTNFDASNYIDRLREKIPGFNPHSYTQPEAELPNCCSTQSEVEVEVDQQQQPQKVAADHLNFTQLPPCNMETSTMVALDPANEQDPWSFFDTGFAPLRVPDIPLEKPCELTDLFNHTGFEDDIDLIFDAAAACNTDAGCGAEQIVGVSMRVEGGDNGEERLLCCSTSSPSSSTRTTTTTVSCIY